MLVQCCHVLSCMILLYPRIPSPQALSKFRVKYELKFNAYEATRISLPDTSVINLSNKAGTVVAD